MLFIIQIGKIFIYVNKKSKLGNLSWGGPEISHFDSYYTKV